MKIKDRNHGIAIGVLCALMLVATIVAKTIFLINSISKI
jgi:tetrahydromethanopterin S-methyltransferase subunit F